MAIPLSSALSITRQAAGSYVAGVWTPGATATVTVQAHVQPESTSEDADQELSNRLGVESLVGCVRVYSDDQLYPVTATKEGDRFTWQGKTYEVVDVQRWAYLSIAHWSSLARLITSTVN